MIRRPPRSTLTSSSAASDVYKRQGHKLPDEVEDAVEARMSEAWTLPIGADVGRVRDLPEATGRYVDHLVATVPRRLDGLRVVVDCAHGAASAAAPAAYRAAGAEVVAIGAAPDGLNINDGCGSTHPAGLMAAVRAHRADVGLAHDGDADRLSLIHISEPTRLLSISYAVFCLKKKKQKTTDT